MGFPETIRELLKIAHNDGLLTMDEFTLISNVNVGLSDYEKHLEKAMEDGVIDNVEKVILRELKMKIYEKANVLVNADGIITDDEKALLVALSKFVASIKP